MFRDLLNIKTSKENGITILAIGIILEIFSLLIIITVSNLSTTAQNRFDYLLVASTIALISVYLIILGVRNSWPTTNFCCLPNLENSILRAEVASENYASLGIKVIKYPVFPVLPTYEESKLDPASLLLTNRVLEQIKSDLEERKKMAIEKAGSGNWSMEVQPNDSVRSGRSTARTNSSSRNLTRSHTTDGRITSGFSSTNRTNHRENRPASSGRSQPLRRNQTAI